MDLGEMAASCGLSGAPVGLAGCRASGGHLGACPHDLVVFDGGPDPPRAARLDGETAVVHHASLGERDPGLLLRYDGMRIISDESWELHMLLSRIRELRPALLESHARGCLIESMFCCRRAADAVERGDALAPCWQKCASHYLADGLAALGGTRPSPTHMLDSLRRVKKSTANDRVAAATESMGIERATPTLLRRMAESAAGFAGLVGGVHPPEVIRAKCGHMASNSMLADCYFYLGCVNRDNFVWARDRLAREPDLFYVLKTAFDVGADTGEVLRQADSVRDAAASVLESVSGARLTGPVRRR